jgi:hypothetical protein
MPGNRRENILQRISDITVGVKGGGLGIISAVRNRGLLSTEQRPATVLLDGDENQFTNIPNKRGRAESMRPQIIRMTPQLYIILAESRPTNDASPLNGADLNVGTALNLLRNAVVIAMGTDAELKTLYGMNGGFIYNGCTTDLKSGSALTGQMLIDFNIIYPYDPATEG